MPERRGGIGGFGYFDMDRHTWTLHSPPEVSPWSVSALLLNPNAVWLGLSRGSDEGFRESGGIVRWDRKTERV